MPREFGGGTVLGSKLNDITSKQDGMHIVRSKTKFGIIKEVVGRTSNQGVYTVILQIISPEGKPEQITGPIPLQEHPSFLAANYGPPDQLVGRYICRVDYKGSSINRGVASIVRNLDNDREITEQTNQVQITGTAFAPPGNGLV